MVQAAHHWSSLKDNNINNTTQIQLNHLLPLLTEELYSFPAVNILYLRLYCSSVDHVQRNSKITWQTKKQEKKKKKPFPDMKQSMGADWDITKMLKTIGQRLYNKHTLIC